MFCVKCGSQLQPEDRFCKSCGNPAKATDAPAGSVYDVPPPAPRRAGVPLSLKKLMPVLLVSVAVIAVGVLAWLLGPSLFGGSQQAVSGSIVLFNADGETVVSADTSPKYSLDAPSISNLQRSLDGRTAALVTKGGGDAYGDLYVLTAGGKTLVSDGVSGFQLASSGKGIAYVKDYDYQSYSGTLYLYDCASKKSEKVAEGVYSQGEYLNTGLSPDGRTVGYITDLDQTAMTFTGNLKTLGKPAAAFGENMLPLAMTDGASILYYIQIKSESSNPTMVFKVRSAGKDVELTTSDASSIGNGFAPMFNADNTQMLFSSGGKTYVSKNGGEKVRLYSKAISSVPLPPYTPINTISIALTGMSSCGLADFSNFCIVTTDNTLVFIGADGQGSKVASDPRSFSVAGGSKCAYVVDDTGTLYRCTMGNEIRKEEIAPDVAAIQTSQDGSRLYYVTTDNELYFAGGGQKPVKVADGVHTSSLSLAADGNTLYYLTDYTGNAGTLYVSKGGGKGDRVADDVYQVSAMAAAVYYYSSYDSSYNTYDVYRAGSDGKFTLLQEGVSGTR